MGRKTRRRVEEGIYADEYGYSAIVTIHRHPHEKRFPPRTPLKVMRDWRERTREAFRRGSPPTTRGTLSADVKVYLRQVRHLGDELKSVLKAWTVRLGHKPRWSITPADVRLTMAAWTDNGVAPKTIANRLGALRRVYRVLDGARAWCPCDEIDPPHAPRTPPVFVTPDLIRQTHDKLVAQEQAGKLRDAKTRARFMIRAASGVRPCEIMRAQPSDVDLERRIWRTRDAKGGYRPGGIYLTTDLLAAWQVFIAADAWGKFNTGSQARVLRTAGWPENVRPYNLRHTLGMALSEAGVDLADVSAVLGHTRPLTTRSHYVPVLGSRLQDALGKVDSRIGWTAANMAPAHGTAHNTPKRGII